MTQPTYRQALSEAWKLTYRNTGFWLLGLLSALFAGSFGLSNFLSQIMVTMGTGGRALWLTNFHFPNLGLNSITAVLLTLWLLGVVIALAIVVIYISITAKATLMIAIADYYKKETLPKMSKIWNSGLKFFWKIFTIEVIRKVALGLTGLIFGFIWIKLPFSANGLNLVLIILSLVFTVILAFIISATCVFASGYAIIDKKSVRNSFEKGWKLFHEHSFVAFEISAILTIIDLLIIVIFGVIISYSFIPSIFIWLIAGVFGSTTLALFGAAFGLALIVIFIAIFGGMYNTFYTSVWMYLFMKMHHEGIMSRLIHHLGGFIKK
jgi:hypothetical protein